MIRGTRRIFSRFHIEKCLQYFYGLPGKIIILWLHSIGKIISGTRRIFFVFISKSGSSNRGVRLKEIPGQMQSYWTLNFTRSYIRYHTIPYITYHAYHTYHTIRTMHTIHIYHTCIPCIWYTYDTYIWYIHMIHTWHIHMTHTYDTYMGGSGHDLGMF